MNSRQLIEGFKNGMYDGQLLELYIVEEQIPYQRERYTNAIQTFEDLFHTEKENMDDIEIYSAPGRTEIGGNHTDHQCGRVLTSAVNMDMIAVVQKNNDQIIRIQSEGYPMIRVNCTDTIYKEAEEGSTDSLVKGILHTLKEHEFHVGGFSAYITSDVPTGSGLSSSAAFEVLIGRILSGLYGQNQLTAVQNACFGQFAESTYFGKPCGLMDQMACSVGGLMQIDFQNPKEPLITGVKSPLLNQDYQLCIVDVKSSHHELTDEYAAIPREMGLIAAHYGKKVLREVDEALFLQELSVLRTRYGDRSVLRAFHFFQENRRVEEEAKALLENDIDNFLKLVKKSGDSSYKYLQNIYANEAPQSQGLSIALALSEEFLGEKGACRVHGGGFAGTIQVFVPKEMAGDYRHTMEAVFGENSCHFLKLRPCGAVKVL